MSRLLKRGPVNFEFYSAYICQKNLYLYRKKINFLFSNCNLPLLFFIQFTLFKCLISNKTL